MDSRVIGQQQKQNLHIKAVHVTCMCGTNEPGLGPTKWLSRNLVGEEVTVANIAAILPVDPIMCSIGRKIS